MGYSVRHLTPQPELDPLIRIVRLEPSNGHILSNAAQIQLFFLGVKLIMQIYKLLSHINFGSLNTIKHPKLAPQPYAV